MILADTSVWIDHLCPGKSILTEFLEREAVCMHPFVIGELALGTLRSRTAILSDLNDLPTAPMADPREVLALIEQEKLYGLGIGYIDVHLLASVRLMPGTTLWTFDKRLAAAAQKLSVAAAFH